MNRDLDTMKKLGFHAVTVQAGRRMPSPYLSKGYFQLFRKFVEAAKKRGMMGNGRKSRFWTRKQGMCAHSPVPGRTIR